jgi:hypothetical protein
VCCQASAVVLGLLIVDWSGSGTPVGDSWAHVPTAARGITLHIFEQLLCIILLHVSDRRLFWNAWGSLGL